MINESNDEGRYNYIVVGAGAAGSVLAAELSASGAQVLVIESGGPDDASTIANPSVWFYNVGGPLDYHLPITPLPQLNNRNFNMALGHVLIDVRIQQALNLSMESAAKDDDHLRQIGEEDQIVDKTVFIIKRE
jgi:choline dehydrogenase-like flavoprotein